MLSQEELDKLLEEGGASESSDGTSPEDQEDGKAGDQQGDGEGKDEAGETREQAAQDDTGGDVDWSEAFAEAAAGGDAAAAKAMEQGGETEQPEASAPEFNDFAKAAPPGPTPSESHPNLDFIMDLPLEVSVELGRSRMQIKDLLQLSQGSVIELNKVAGEPAEIYVNQKLMAKGEVVVVNDRFGIRLTEIISPADRVRSLG